MYAAVASSRGRPQMDGTFSAQTLVLLLAACIIGGASQAAAQTVQSHYTSVAPKACKVHAKSKSTEEMAWIELACPGAAATSSASPRPTCG